MKKQLFPAWLLAAAMLFPVLAQAQLRYDDLWMRSTSAASVARQTNWATGPRGNTTGFADTFGVFRRGVTTRTVYDTTAAYHVGEFPLPPGFGTVNAVGDTSVPWFVLRVIPDTTSLSFTGSSSLGSAAADSVRIAVEMSYDGGQWLSCRGTPTYRFDTVFMTNGEDALQNTTLIGVGRSEADDAAYIPIKCNPGVTVDNAFIINRTLCMSGAMIRFIVGGAYTGQYRLQIGTWR